MAEVREEVVQEASVLPQGGRDDRHVVRIGRLDQADAIELVGNVLGEDAARPQSGDAGELSMDEIKRAARRAGPSPDNA